MITKLKYDSHDEWLQIRNKYIGGSDAGAVVGMNPYKGALSLWMEKTGKAKSFEGNISTECGTLLEPYVAELFTRETGRKVRRDNHTMVNDLYPFACANVDRRIVGENALLECKTTTSLPNLKKFKAGEYPETWYCQMTHYLAVTGAERVYLAVLINCREFKWFVLERDESEINALMAAEKAFWAHVEDGTPPEPNAYDGDAVKEAYPAENADTDAVADLTPCAPLLRQYEDAVREMDAAEGRVNEIKNRLCAALGECSVGRYEGYTVKWKPCERATLDTKRLKIEHPEIDYGAYSKVSVSRRFDFAKREEK